MGDRLEGKVALVTGAASGIGRASAVTLASEGAKVVVTDVDDQDGEEAAHDICQAGGDAIFQPLDVADATQVETAVRRSIDHYGRLDCAHNNAGTEGPVEGSRGTLETTEAEWDRLMAINLKGIWLCMRSEIPRMLEQNGGAIVNSASISSLVGSTSGFVAYSASKSGILGLTRSAALEFAPRNIRINAICPGYITTPLWEKYFDDEAVEKRVTGLQPIGRMGTAEEVAEAVAWLLSDAASLVTGVAFPLDGGFTAQ